MSVNLYGDDKFTEIFWTLRFFHEGNDKLGWLFGYPGGWKEPNGVDHDLKAWLDDLKRSNALTWNRQYVNSKQPLSAVNYLVHPRKRTLSLIELYASLRGLRYNLVDNGGQETDLNKAQAKLDLLLDHVGYQIISTLSGFDKAVGEFW